MSGVLLPNNLFKPNPQQGGVWLHAFGYIRTQSRPTAGRLNSGVRLFPPHSPSRRKH